MTPDKIARLVELDAELFLGLPAKQLTPTKIARVADEVYGYFSVFRPGDDTAEHDKQVIAAILTRELAPGGDDPFAIHARFVPDNQGGHIAFSGKTWRPE